MKLIAEAKGIVICRYNEETATTQNDWTTFLLTPDDRIRMRHALETFLAFVKANRVSKHIVNTKHCTESFLQEDMDWLVNYFGPMGVKNGIRYLANILSDDIFAQLTSEEWQEKTVNGLVVKNFTTLEEAKLWLTDKG